MGTNAKPKLSELIRKGAAMVDGQCTGDYIKRHTGDFEDVVECCALGAAFYALTGELPKSLFSYTSNERVPRDVLSEAVGGWGGNVSITQMNDVKRMTFEEIAAELEAKGL